MLTFVLAAMLHPAFGLSPARPKVFAPPPHTHPAVIATARNAKRVRAALTNLEIPADATLWVYGVENIPIAFDVTLAYAGTLWTPSVGGDTIFIESDREVRFDVFAVAEVAEPAGDTSCFVDVACSSDATVDRVSTAIGRYSFVSGRDVLLCTGALIVDSRHSFLPYFLTAAHCAMTEAEAATVEVFWDVRAESCGANVSLDARPRTNGARIAAMQLESDISLLTLSSVPGPRWFLGWTSERPVEGTVMRRISHPFGMQQKLSATRVDETSGSCSSFPDERFIRSLPVSGCTAGGSSGAPAWIDDGVIVGQLATLCGSRSIDGAFSYSYRALQPLLDPPKRRAVRR